MSNPEGAPPGAGSSLLSGYPHAADGYDELYGSDGAPRSHWRPALEALEGLGPEALRRCEVEARRVLRGRGATDEAAATGASHRLWPLNLLPYPVSASDWARIEAGLRQRAELLDRILTDLYGPRTLLHRGLLPPELVLGHRGFLRPCDGLPRQGPRAVPVYAADVVRTGDGGLCVVAERAQAPAGLGYALEARSVLARVVPSLIRSGAPRPIDAGLELLGRSVRAAAPGGSGRQAAVLTPGPFNPAYLEHAILAHRLGYPLAQGPDLTIRDGRVSLRTVDGTRAVDVLLRRLDDDYCDPLELRKDSLLGVPGLVQAVRRGALGVVNPLGSGALDNPGLAGYLPGLARELLGEELALASPPTWWCGDADARERVLSSLDALTVHALDDGTVSVGSALGEEARAALADAIRADPRRFVAQEVPTASQAPILRDGMLEPRQVVLRFQVVSDADGEYTAVPGGVARETTGTLIPGLGGASQDIWVLGERPPTAGRIEAPAPVSRAAAEVPSRMAESLFWLGRYTERAERHARLLREILLRWLPTAGPVDDPAARVMLAAATHVTATYPGFAGAEAERRFADPEPEILALVDDAARPGSVRADVESAVRAAAAVRDLVSDDTARTANRLEEALDAPARLEDLPPVFEVTLTRLAALAELAREGIAPGTARVLFDAGRHLERALGTVRELRPTLVFTMPDTSVREALLAVTESTAVYRRNYTAELTSAVLLELLVCDGSHPRSLVVQLERLRECVDALPPAPDAQDRAREGVEGALAAARTVEACDPADQPELGGRLDAIESALNAVSAALAEGYFQREALPQQMVSLQ